MRRVIRCSDGSPTTCTMQFGPRTSSHTWAATSSDPPTRSRLSDRDGAPGRADRQITRSYDHNGVTVGSASIGITSREPGAGHVLKGEWLLVASDRAMYGARRQGRGWTVVTN